MKRNQGFTLLEFIIIMGLISFLSAVLLVSSQQQEKRLALKRSTFKLFQDLREIQGRAMSGQAINCGSSNTYSFGFYFNNDSYIIFADCNNNQQKDSSDEIIREVEMENGVEIYTTNPSPLTIVFSPPDPVTYINGSSAKQDAKITIALSSNPADANNQKKIKINTAGMVEIE